MFRIAVYTCISGQFEQPKNNQNFEGADFFLFTDNKLLNTPWRIKPITNLFKDPRRSARFHKILSHEFFPDYDYTIWLDGSITLKIPAFNLIDKMNHVDIMALKHLDRVCAYDEAMECLDKQLDYPENLHKIMSRMRESKYPIENGLGETKVLIRKNTKKVEEFNREWFYQLFTTTLRDQVTFNFSAWLTNNEVGYLPSWKERPEWYKYDKHIRKIYESQT